MRRGHARARSSRYGRLRVDVFGRVRDEDARVRGLDGERSSVSVGRARDTRARIADVCEYAHHDIDDWCAVDVFSTGGASGDRAVREREGGVQR